MGLLEEILDVEKVVAFQPHPDDVDLAAGGLIKKLTIRGAEAIYVTLTDGSSGTLDLELTPEKLAEIRRREQERAAEILGVKESIWLGYRDAYLPYSFQIRDQLIRILRRYKPELVLTPDPWVSYEAHPDHRHGGLMGAEAAFYASLPNVNRESIEEGLTPLSPSYVVFYFTEKPNLYVDVTDIFGYKVEAVKKHESQFGEGIEEILKKIGEKYGAEIGVKYAEAFKVVRPYCLHVFGVFCPEF